MGRVDDLLALFVPLQTLENHGTTDHVPLESRGLVACFDSHRSVDGEWPRIRAVCEKDGEKEDLEILFEIANTEAGHMLPTGDPERFITFDLRLLSATGAPLGETQEWIGSRYEWWPETRLLLDNRLRPHEQRTVHFRVSQKAIPQGARLEISVPFPRIRKRRRESIAQLLALNGPQRLRRSTSPDNSWATHYGPQLHAISGRTRSSLLDVLRSTTASLVLDRISSPGSAAGQLIAALTGVIWAREPALSAGIAFWRGTGHCAERTLGIADSRAVRATPERLLCGASLGTRVGD